MAQYQTSYRYLYVVNDSIITSSNVSNPRNISLPANGSWVLNCSSPMETLDFYDPKVAGSLVPLGLICLMVIFGNAMVIAAVRMTSKMRGATNLFITSLAWADLTLGLVVLPSSAAYEVFDRWVFGAVWCSVWLAVDVWTCTASILHLVVISLDRFIAVTHPITYPNIMTSRRAKMLIAGAWILSFVICFPPLVGWRSDKDGEDGEDAVVENSDKLVIQLIRDRCLPTCKLSQDTGYVIFSAVGSFYAPMLVMMFFNYKIYRTATRTTKAIRQGWTKVKGLGGDEGSAMGIHRGGGAAAIALAASTVSMASTKAVSGMPRNNSSAPPTATLRLPSSRRTSATTAATDPNGIRRNQKGGSRTLPRSASSTLSNGGPSTAAAAAATAAAAVSNRRRRDSGDDNRSCGEAHTPLLLSPHQSARLTASANSLHVPHQDFECSGGRRQQPQPPSVSHHQPCPNHIMGKTFAEQGTQTDPSGSRRSRSRQRRRFLSHSANRRLLILFRRRRSHTADANDSPPSSTRSLSRDKSSSSGISRRARGCFRFQRWRHSSAGAAGSNESADSDACGVGITIAAGSGDIASMPGSTDELSKVTASNNHLNVRPPGGGSQHPHKSLGKRNIKSQVRRFRMETKAAKTLGIVVGCFICCWFPFFTMYLIGAFCKDCFPRLAFSIIFWLGYCNSVINPFIYAMFSRDFRNAFKKILCKFLCRRRSNAGARQVGALASMPLPFTPHTVGIGLADRFPPNIVVPPPVSAAASAAVSEREANSTSSSTRTQRKSSYILEKKRNYIV